MSGDNQKDSVVDFEKEVEKERKQTLEHFFNELNRNPNAPVTEKMFKARYSVKSSKAKAMVKLYKNQRNILKYYHELTEIEEEKTALEDLLKREGQVDDKQRKQLKNFRSRIESLQKGIAKAQKYADIRTEERDNILLLADGNHVLWVIGYRISEDVKVTDSTKEILYISLSKEEEQ